MNQLTVRAHDARVDLKKENITRILLVRGLFRLGDAILATPAISLMNHNFPKAEIDFVGPSITKKLFTNLPINRYYEIDRSFPRACWVYPTLLKRLRHRKYDLALDTSGSSAALGSFIVGFSGARFRVGIKGKWDRWFNVRVDRSPSPNKYKNLPQLFASLGLRTAKVRPSIMLTAMETDAGRKRVEALTGNGEKPIVGIFVGGRKSRGKRWPNENFVKLVTLLRTDSIRPIVFAGPEETDSLVYLRFILGHRVPVVFEPDITSFAALVANCDLFVTCDSGPLHLASALGVRTVAIFLKSNFDRWGPPPDLASIVFRESGVEVENVIEACRTELRAICKERVAGKIMNIKSWSRNRGHRSNAASAENSGSGV